MQQLLSAFPWPPLRGSTIRPCWNGEQFVLGDERRDVLCYEAAQSNWSPELTALHEAEAGSNHPIDQASRALAIRSVRQFSGQGEQIVLDVGCSSGFLLDELRRMETGLALIGSDFIAPPLFALARRLPGVPLLQFDLRHCPLPDSCVDVVTALNVLEHIAEDDQALREIFRILKPGGMAHVEVPAGAHLYDIYDEHLMHHRRYGLSQLRAMAVRTGFKTLKATHLGVWMYPAFAWVKRRNRRLLDRSAEEKSRIVAGQIRSTSRSILLRAILQWETALGRMINYPCGIRCVIVLRKP
jgi:SAM-dependent methyltransferase